MKKNNKNHIIKYMNLEIKSDSEETQICVVSNKIVNDGWKVGIMYKDAPLSKRDSGWRFMVGNEDENNDSLCVMNLKELFKYDSNVIPYIYSGVANSYRRVDSNKFVIEYFENPTLVYIEKQN